MWVIRGRRERELAPPGAPLFAALEVCDAAVLGGLEDVTPRCARYVVAERDVLRELARNERWLWGKTTSRSDRADVDKVMLEGATRHVEAVNERLKARISRGRRGSIRRLQVDSTGRAGMFCGRGCRSNPNGPPTFATAALATASGCAGLYFRPTMRLARGSASTRVLDRRRAVRFSSGFVTRVRVG